MRFRGGRRAEIAASISPNNLPQAAPQLSDRDLPAMRQRHALLGERHDLLNANELVSQINPRNHEQGRRKNDRESDQSVPLVMADLLLRKQPRYKIKQEVSPIPPVPDRPDVSSLEKSGHGKDTNKGRYEQHQDGAIHVWSKLSKIPIRSTPYRFACSIGPGASTPVYTRSYEFEPYAAARSRGWVIATCWQRARGVTPLATTSASSSTNRCPLFS